MGWTEEEDAMLRRCFGEHMSSSEAAAAINARFRTNYSRNAIIGRALRQKIKSANPPRGVVRSPKSGTAMERRVRGQRPRIIKAKPAVQQFACEPLTGLRIADVVPRHILLLELTDATCKWPYGEGPYTFCGCETFEGPYCEPHAALSAKPMQGVNFNQTEHQRAAHRKSRMPTIVSLARDMDAA